MKLRGNGIGICGVLTIVFVVLKLIGEITWSWLWVLSPLWIDFGITIVVWVLFFIYYIVKKWWDED